MRAARTSLTALALSLAAVPAFAAGWIDPPARHARSAEARPAQADEEPAPDDDDMAQAERSAEAGERSADRASKAPEAR